MNTRPKGYLLFAIYLESVTIANIITIPIKNYIRNNEHIENLLVFIMLMMYPINVKIIKPPKSLNKFEGSYILVKHS